MSRCLAVALLGTGLLAGPTPEAAAAWFHEDPDRVLRGIEFGDPTGPFDSGTRSSWKTCS